MLAFKYITLDSLDEIRGYLSKQNYRTCDYSIGGIYMWAPYFNYQYCIKEDTLFIMGNSVDDGELSFAMPIGGQNAEKSLNMLKEYCNHSSIPLVLSSIPEEALPVIQSVFKCRIRRLDDWADYLYNSRDLAELTGRKYNKKRNHVNKFKRLYPDFKYERITETNIGKVKEFFDYFQTQINKENELFVYEERMVRDVLENYSILGFIGGMITVSRKVIAFTIGEAINDTLFIHVEKALREYSGVYEAINMFFAQDVADESIKYINREEDVGDPGLRLAKESYYPVALLHKYDVEVQDAE